MTGAVVQELVIQYEPRLVEEAVLRALRGRAEEAPFRRQRDDLYAIPDAETREAGFRAFHAAWFERLGLGEGVARALNEQPSVPAAITRCLVTSAVSTRDEMAELFVASGNGAGGAVRTVVIRIRPETLAAPEGLTALLRHEIFHIVDMLDPRFGYQPRGAAAAAPLGDRLLRDRYRVLWDTYIDGRLARLGRAAGEIRGARLDEFTRAFPMLGERTEEAFERFFGAASLTHAELLAFAGDPEGAFGGTRAGPHPGERCPLCGFPTHAFEPEPHRLPHEVREGIREGFPGWEPAQGLCRLCADLYRSRARPLG